MGKAVEEAGLDNQLVELVKLRVSQINNCAFCLQIHLNVARRIGVPQEKLDLVATWEEAGICTARECAALAWAEQLAHLPDRSVLGRGLCRREPALRRERTAVAERRHRQHQCQEPARGGVPFRAAD
jgi:AhpD family alkylhydroperoxidase